MGCHGDVRVVGHLWALGGRVGFVESGAEAEVPS